MGDKNVETFECENCGKRFPLPERGDVHWLIRIGGLFSLFAILPGTCCRHCETQVYLVGCLGLLIALGLIPAVIIGRFLA